MKKCLAVVVVLCFVVLGSRADTVYTTTTNGVTWTWTLTDGGAVLGGGAGTSSNGTAVPTAVPKDTAGVLVIPETIEGHQVVGLNCYAFWGCKALQSISIPDGVTTIGVDAFAHCTALNHVALGSGITKIPSYAFRDCSSLQKIDIPSNVTAFDSSAFGDCTGLKNFVIPDHVTSLGSSVFSGCYALTNVVIGIGITAIPSSAFNNCTGLRNFVIPDHITSIGSSSFSGCSALTNVRLPEGVASIGDYAFLGCTSLSEIDFPLSLRWMGVGSFSGCNSLKSVFIPGGTVLGITNAVCVNENTVTTLGSGDVTTSGSTATSVRVLGTFEECDSLKTVTIAEGVRAIGVFAFRKCRNLEMVSLPESLETICPGTFSECPSLKEIRLPERLKAIGVLTLPGTTIVIPGRTITTTTITADGSTVTSTTTTPPIERSISGGTTVKGSFGSEAGAFFRCTSLHRIEIPATVEHIGDYTFAGCTGLKEVKFMGDEPTSYGLCILLGTPKDLIVSVEKDAYGWYDPITSGALATWQGRTVAYDGETLASADAESVEAGFKNMISVFQIAGATLTDDEKRDYSQWGMRLVQSCPESLPSYMEFLSNLGVSLTDSERVSMVAWATSAVSDSLTGGDTTSTESSSSAMSSDASPSDVVEARLTVTNVVMHYVQEVASAPSVESLPADGLVAVISEVKGSEAISVPCSWTNSFPRFVEAFGSDFVAALTKPTGKTGANGAPMLVWQDYVAGTDPTDPTSRFSATIDFVDGHPVVTWSPKVEDAAFPRVYRIYGKASLNDADWTELSEDSLNGYNFFKVTVEMAER